MQTVPAPKLKSDKSEKQRTKKPQPDDEAELVTLQPEGAPEAPYDDERAAPGKRECDPALLDGVNTSDHQIDSDHVVSRVLSTIPTYKKRLAYYLYLHNVPAKSKTEHSIAKACGVSERTVRAWIEEIENDLKQNETEPTTETRSCLLSIKHAAAQPQIKSSNGLTDIRSSRRIFARMRR